MPWTPSYSREEAEIAVRTSTTWADALRYLGLAPYGKNFATIRKWVAEWNIPAGHLPPYRPRSSGPAFTESEARAAIAAAHSWAEALRLMAYCPTGGNPKTLKKWAERWGINTDHFDPHAGRRAALAHSKKAKPLEEILVENSTYQRGALKRRLYEAGLKEPICELCGQDEIWHGKRISLIIDHINGKRDDNRIENLQIVCPNCAATLPTHCGRSRGKRPWSRDPQNCVRCGKEFIPKRRDHKYCSAYCGSRWDRRGVPKPGARQVIERPPHRQLLAEIKRLGYRGVGRKYGVSDNSIRKWVRSYEHEQSLAEGGNSDQAKTPSPKWPKQMRLDDAA